MDLAYSAAEYFIEAIRISPDFSITYDYLKILRNLANRKTSSDVAAYLNKNSKTDPFYIFKKFPDIFILKRDSICLTDAFISVYNLNTAPPKSSQTSNVNNSDIENLAVLYFQKIVSLYGPQHFLSLFHTLINDYTQLFSVHFRHYTTAAAFRFFQVHSDYFVLVNETVCLNVKMPLKENLLESDLTNSKAMNKFKLSVQFLLHCFQSLHYIELKQCITYISVNAKKALGSMTLVRQREFFQNLPDTKMDEFGCLSLDKKEFCLESIDSKSKVKLLIVCILAFKREMHFHDVVIEVANRIPPSVNYLYNKSLEEERSFFKRYSSYFLMSQSGHVSLLPSFILPICSFKEQSTSENNFQPNGDEINSDLSCSASDDLNANKNIKTAVHFENTSKNTLNKNLNKSPGDLDNLAVNKYLLCISGLPKMVNERIKMSVFYLLKYFSQLDNKCVLKTLLHVLNDARISFCSLSETDKDNFVKVSCRFMKTISSNSLDSISAAEFKILEKEKVLLFIIYTLTIKEKLHYSKFVQEMNDKKIESSLPTSQNSQFQYFKNLAEYVNIGNDGYVMLSQSFYPIQSVIDSYSDMFSEKNIASSQNRASKKSETISWTARYETEAKTGIKATGDSSKNYDGKSVINSPSVDKLPENIYKILGFSSYFITKYFRKGIAEYILAASLLALNDLYRYFCSISSVNHYSFLKKCYTFLNKESTAYYATIISTEEKTLLFIIYLLLNEKQLHFQKIILNLNYCGLNPSLCEDAVKCQFRYFKNFKEYFFISGEGFVTLNSSSKYITSAVKLAIPSVPVTQDKLRNSILCSSTKTSSELPAKNNITSSPSQSKFININVVRTEDSKISENYSQTLQVDFDTRKNVVDLCFLILSKCGKMQFEKLSCRLNSCNLKEIHNFFSFSTVTEKLNFFKSFPDYLNVSKDGFVSLTENAVKTHVPKTNINLSEIFKSSTSSSEKSFEMPRTRSGSVASADGSVFSGSVSEGSCKSTQKKRMSKLSKQNRQKLSQSSTDDGKRSENRGNLKNNSLESMSNFSININNELNTIKRTCGDEISVSKPALQSEAKSMNSYDYKNVCDNSTEIFTRDRETFQPTSIKSGTQSDPKKLSVSESASSEGISALVNRAKYLSLNQIPQGASSKETETITESVLLPVPKVNLFMERSIKDNPIHNSKNARILKMPYKSVQNSFCGQSESSIVLSKNVSSRNVPIDSLNNDISTLSLSNAYENKWNQSLGEKHNASKNAPDLENFSKFDSDSSAKANKMHLPVSNIPCFSSDNFHCDALQSDYSHKAYITELIDSYLNNTKSNSKISSVQNILGLQDVQVYDNAASYFTDKTESDSILEEPAIVKPGAKAGYSTELRAVNFFCFLLASYANREHGISIEFLKRHMPWASSEVQMFMHEHYKRDFLPFFQKHKKVFYVSVQSRHVYMLKNSSNMM